MGFFHSGKAPEGGIVPDVALVLNQLLRFFATASLLIAGISPLLAQTTVEPPPPLGERAIPSASLPTPADLPLRIEQALHQSSSDGGPADSPEAAVIRLFYHARGYRPVWTGNERTRAVLAAVEASRAHGLAPADFAIDALRREAAGGGGDRDAIVRRELLFTGALARLARQLHYGKVDPRALYSIWNFSPLPDASERAQMLTDLLEADSLTTALAALAPQDRAYRALQKGLSRFTELAASGGWPSIPAGATLRPGEREARVRALRARLQAEDPAADLAAAPGSDPARYDKALAAAVERFQRVHGLAVDGAVGPLTLAALNVSAADRAAQIRVNLERLRWVARDMPADRLAVDITGFNAELHLDGALRWSSKVVVGRPARQTPVLLDEVQHIVLNPKWVVPPTILREDVIPGMIANAAYLKKRQLRVVDRSGQVVAPELIDWSGVRRTGFPYRIEQQSGADGALGRIKFALANGYAIYLHDTPSPAHFQKPVRALSSGCVRLEKPRELALLLLDDPQRWDKDALDAAIASRRTQSVPVGRYVPVLLLYRTAVADELGTVSFRSDIYDQDGAVRALLDTPARPR